jgi:hypothetical protein
MCRLTTLLHTLQVDAFPYSSVLPFLKEHIQPSDQLLVLGARNDLPLRLSADGYGTRYCITVMHVYVYNEHVHRNCSLLLTCHVCF